MNTKVELKHYDYDKNETVSDGTVDTRTIAKNITAEQLASILEDFLNSYNSAPQSGFKVGQKFQESHRTLQGCAVNFALGLLQGIADKNDYTDPRNEVAIKTAKRITEMMEHDQGIKFQPFI